jgi:hypothetical protein
MPSTVGKSASIGIISWLHMQIIAICFPDLVCRSMASNHARQQSVKLAVLRTSLLFESTAAVGEIVSKMSLQVVTNY